MFQTINVILCCSFLFPRIRVYVRIFLFPVRLVDYWTPELLLFSTQNQSRLKIVWLSLVLCCYCCFYYAVIIPSYLSIYKCILSPSATAIREYIYLERHLAAVARRSHRRSVESSLTWVIHIIRDYRKVMRGIRNRAPLFSFLFFFCTRVCLQLAPAHHITCHIQTFIPTRPHGA